MVTLRIEKPAQDDLKTYMERLVKLIPSEVVGIYLIGFGIIPKAESIALVIWTLVCLGLVIIARAYATRDQANNKPTQWLAVIISSMSFVIWVYTLGHAFVPFNMWIPWIGSLIVLVWTFIIPYFYKGD